MKFIKFLAAALLAAPVFTACNDDPAPNSPTPTIDPVGKVGAIVINQGLLGQNNAAFSTFMFSAGNGGSSFNNPEKGKLGDTPQNAVKIDSLLYVAANGTNAVEVYNVMTLRKKTSIQLNNVQSVAALGKQVYAVARDSVFRINTASNKVEGRVHIGYGGYMMTAANNHLYINRGWTSQGVFSIVTKVSPAAFAKGSTLQAKDIQVGLNPYNQLVADENGTVYTVCSGNYSYILPEVWKIDANDVASKVTEGKFIAVRNKNLYVIDEVAGKYNFHTYDINNYEKKSSNFLPAATNVLKGISFFAVNPYSGRFYFGTNEAGYTAKGFVYEFSEKGDALLKKTEAGYNPYSILFY